MNSVETTIYNSAREIETNTYSPIAYYLANILTDIPELIVWSLMIVTGFYFVVGMDADPGKFFYLCKKGITYFQAFLSFCLRT